MPQPPSVPKPVAWQGDPTRDFLVYLLISMARSALIEHFEDDDAKEAYAKLHARPPRRAAGSGKPRELQHWDDDAGCSVTLRALPERNRFIVAAGDDSFKAEVSAIFEPVEFELHSATVTSFTGNSEAAAKSIDARIEDLLDAGDLDLSLADLFGALPDDDDDDDDDLDFAPDDDDADVFAPDDDAAGSAPPKPSPEEAEVVRRMARRLGRRFADDKAPDLTDQDRDWLETTPQSLWPLLDGTLEEARKLPHDDAVVSAWQFLLGNQLELIRYRSERDWPWAKEMLDTYQDRLVALAREGKTDGDVLFLLVAALNQAKIPVRPDVGEAIIQGDTEAATLEQSPQALSAGMHAVIDELAHLVGTPYETAEALRELTSIAPPEMRAFLAHELALAPHATLRDTVPLMLLDESSEVRRAAAAALEQIAVPDTLSPEALRRTIALRNWIPDPDRAAVDQAIRKARTKGVPIAQWDKPGELAFHASPIDGAGAQSLLAASRAGRRGVFCGVLAKQEFGIRDAWSNTDMPRREIASGLAEVQRTIASPEVTREYFDVSVQHHIAVGLANGNLPSSALLELAETIGAADWKDRRIDAAAETQQLFDALSPAERSNEAIGAALRRTGTWAERDRMAESWFADEAEARDVIGEFKGRDKPGAARALLDSVLEKQRPVWAERCLLMALWARAVKSGQKAPAWHDFLLLAHVMQAGRKLAEIPLMMQVAQRSVAATRGRTW